MNKPNLMKISNIAMLVWCSASMLHILYEAPLAKVNSIAFYLCSTIWFLIKAREEVKLIDQIGGF